MIPAHNEEKRIGKTLRAYSTFFEKMRKKKLIEYELFIVINNTKDNTEEVVKKERVLNKRINFAVYLEGGKGFAVKKGFLKGISDNFDLIGFVDADMATPPEQYWKLIENINGAEGCVADRYTAHSKIVPAFSFRRIVVSRVFNLLVRGLYFLGPGDTQCGAKIFTKKTAQKIVNELTITQWAFDLDLLYICKRNGYLIRQIPTIWYEVEGGSINILKTSIEMFFPIVQLRILRSPGKRFLTILEPVISKVYKIIKKR